MGVTPTILLSYIDPVSGSILLQVILAGIIGCIAFFRRSIWGLFRMVFRRRGAGDDSASGERPA